MSEQLLFDLPHKPGLSPKEAKLKYGIASVDTYELETEMIAREENGYDPTMVNRDKIERFARKVEQIPLDDLIAFLNKY